MSLINFESQIRELYLPLKNFSRAIQDGRSSPSEHSLIRVQAQLIPCNGPFAALFAEKFTFTKLATLEIDEKSQWRIHALNLLERNKKCVNKVDKLKKNGINCDKNQHSSQSVKAAEESKDLVKAANCQKKAKQIPLNRKYGVNQGKASNKIQAC